MFDCCCVLVIKCFVRFVSDVMRFNHSKNLRFYQISSPKSRTFWRSFWANVRWIFVFFLVSTAFCHKTPPLDVLQILLWVLLWPPGLAVHVGVILVDRTLLGRFTTVPSFLHLWTKTSHWSFLVFFSILFIGGWQTAKCCITTTIWCGAWTKM